MLLNQKKAAVQPRKPLLDDDSGVKYDFRHNASLLVTQNTFAISIHTIIFGDIVLYYSYLTLYIVELYNDIHSYILLYDSRTLYCLSNNKSTHVYT